MTVEVPAHVRTWTDLVGVEAAVRLILERGGTRVYVPAAPSPDSPLATIVGHEGAIALAGRFGGEYPKVPVARPFLIAWLREQGLSAPRIAQQLHCSENTVWSHLGGSADRQLNLFE